MISSPGTAGVARAWSSYFDSMIGHKILPFFNSTVHMEVAMFSEYPDFFALSITLLLTGLYGTVDFLFLSNTKSVEKYKF